MNEPYHIEICQRALAKSFSDRALETIITANISQDNLRGQFGHPEFHFDSNVFGASYSYIEEQRQIILQTLSIGDEMMPAREAFGRLTHTAQDFYAHSNYISLWVDSFPNGEMPPPSQVDACHPKYLDHPQLATNRIYLWDYLAYLPGLYTIAGRILPEDSHYHTNIDHPGRGPLFPYVIEAAVQRTFDEFRKIQSRIEFEIGPEAVRLFTGKNQNAP